MEILHFEPLYISGCMGFTFPEFLTTSKLSFEFFKIKSYELYVAWPPF
jgi:hypothetical protein